LDPKHDRRRSQQATEEAPELKEAFERAGNFLKSEHSLLMQDRRASKFSQKFREGTVMKILAGKTTIREVQQDLDVTETDLILWIREMMKRKDHRIGELVKTLEAIQGLPVKISTILDADSAEEGRTIDGEIANQ
jgi:transposase-like protein